MAHEQVRTQFAQPGMIIAVDVYNYNHQLILPEGTTLSDYSISKLKKYSIDFVIIEVADNSSESQDVNSDEVAASDEIIEPDAITK